MLKAFEHRKTCLYIERKNLEDQLRKSRDETKQLIYKISVHSNCNRSSTIASLLVNGVSRHCEQRETK